MAEQQKQSLCPRLIDYLAIVGARGTVGHRASGTNNNQPPVQVSSRNFYYLRHASSTFTSTHVSSFLSRLVVLLLFSCSSGCVSRADFKLNKILSRLSLIEFLNEALVPNKASIQPCAP